jgi:hypothetical protein
MAISPSAGWVSARESALVGTGQVLHAFLIIPIFLFPMALYCLILAHVNRSRRPLMISGLWDSVGLLFALSGFLLWTMPTVLEGVSDRLLAYLPGNGDPAVAWAQGVFVWLTYYFLLLCGVLVMLVVRRHKTVIYNIDPELLRRRLLHTLAELGLDSVDQAGRLVVAPAEAFTITAAPAIESFTALSGQVHVADVPPIKTLSGARRGPRYAEVSIEPLGALRNVTLHWENYAPTLRREIEQHLEHAIENAAAVDNPAATWLLSFSGLMFLAITAMAALFIGLIWFFRRP